MKASINDVVQAVPEALGYHRMIGRNTGLNIIYVGFAETVVGEDTAFQGIPIEPGEMFSADMLDRYHRVPHFVCADGETSTFNYDFQ